MILTCHLDESGTHGGSPANVMAGAMGNAAQWTRFQVRMNEMKRRYGFEVFHAKDFRAGSGEFRGWSEIKCNAFLRDFGEAGADLMEVVTCTLPTADYAASYKRVAEDPNKLRLDTAYALCFRYCVTHLAAEAIRRLGQHKRFLQKTSIHIVAESGHQHAGDAERAFRELKREMQGLGCPILKTIAFADKNQCDPLMLADYMAYGTFALERAGQNEPPDPPVEIAPKKVTGLTCLKFSAEGLAELKTKLIANIGKGSSRRTG